MDFDQILDQAIEMLQRRGRLKQQQNNHGEVKQLLGEAYARFTEGLDNTDLLESKTFFQDLQSL